MVVRIPEADWRKAAQDRYGDAITTWRFRCPVCKHVATSEDWRLAGAPEGAVAFACVGRWMEGSADAFSTKHVGDAGGETKGPCNYTGGGLFRLNPVVVVSLDAEHALFDFADRPLVDELATAGAP